MPDGLQVASEGIYLRWEQLTLVGSWLEPCWWMMGCSWERGRENTCLRPMSDQSKSHAYACGFSVLFSCVLLPQPGSCLSLPLPVPFPWLWSLAGCPFPWAPWHGPCWGRSLWHRPSFPSPRQVAERLPLFPSSRFWVFPPRSSSSELHSL